MIKAKELVQQYRSHPAVTLADLQEALRRGRRSEPGGVRPEDFSLRDLAAHAICDKQTGDPIGLSGLEEWCRGRLIEADGMLTTSLFATITGQILNAAILEGYALPEFVLSSVIPAVNGRERQARFVGVSLPLQDNKVLEVQEGQEYPSVGMYDEYAKSGDTKKLAALVRITKEAILQDETGQILDQARQIGQFIGLQKETLLTDYVIGAVSGCVIEKRVGDSAEGAYNLFYTSGRYVNEQVNALGDWTDIDQAENLFLGITMPGTGQPPVLTQHYVLVPPQLRSTAARILTATETRSGSGNVVVAANPLAGLGLKMLTSQLVYSRLVASGVAPATAAGVWFYGDLPRAFRVYQNWDLTVEQNTAGDSAFARDVVAQFKASWRGIPVVVEPRVWSKQIPS